MAKHIIYSNYNLWEDYHEDAKAELVHRFPHKEINESEIWNEIYWMDSFNWEWTSEELQDFFADKGKLLLRGWIERWDGTRLGGKIFDNFHSALHEAVKDCDYLEIYDINGHLFIRSSHHDGTNLFEIKLITDKAYQYAQNWSGVKSEKQIHDTIWNSNFMSSLPHCWKNIYY